MEPMKWKAQIKESVGKYKYVFLILLLGMIFMVQPEKKTTEETIRKTGMVVEKQELSDQLKDILMNIHGAGEVMVMLSVEKGESTIYQSDVSNAETEKGTDNRSQTVLITDAQRNETGLIYQKNPPTYQGAIILAQGADNPTVKLAIVDAVTKITGLGANRISVLKMK